jgi:serine/threonine-protein kinase RsbW
MIHNHARQVVDVRLPSSTKHLHAIHVLTRTLAEGMGFALRESENAALAVDEALSNVIEHGYHGEESHRLRIIFEMKGEKLTVRILHDGEQMDPARFNAEDFAHYYRQKKKGGLGVLIMKKFMDEVTYKSGPRLNECCMVKYLHKNQ